MNKSSTKTLYNPSPRWIRQLSNRGLKSFRFLYHPLKSFRFLYNPLNSFKYSLRNSRRRLLLPAAGLLLTLLPILLYSTFVKPPSASADSLIKFDEGYGDTVTDTTGSATNSGTITNAVWKTDDLCQNHKCLYFDGSGDYISFGDEASFDFLAATDFTIEFWFRHPIIATNPDYAIAKHQASTAGGYKIYMDSDGDMVFGIDDDGTWDTTDIVGDDQSKNYDDNRWHHVAAVKDGTTGIYIYVDGILIDSDISLTETGTLVNAANFYVGIDADGSSNGWQGFIDELKIYTSTARSADEIKTDYLDSTPNRGTSASFSPDQSYLSNGLVGYWKMDEQTENTCDGGEDSCDSSGNQNDGTWSGNAGTGSGKFGPGVTLDGTDDYVDVEDIDLL